MLVRKHGITLVALVVIMGLFAWLLNRQSNIYTEELSPRLVSDFSEKVTAVSEVIIQSDVKTLVLRKTDGGWRLNSESGYPVSVEKLRPLFNALMDGHLVEQKTAQPEKYPRLEVADLGKVGAGVLLTLKTSDNELTKVIVGKKAKGISGVYLRKQGDTQSYLFDRPLPVSLDKADWVERSILDVAASEVSKVEQDAGDESFTIERLGEDFKLFPMPESDQKLKQSYHLNAYFGAIDNLTLLDVFAADDEALPKQFTQEKTIRYFTDDGLSYRVVYKKSQDARHFITVEESRSSVDDKSVGSEESSKEPSEDLDAELSEKLSEEPSEDSSSTNAEPTPNKKFAGWVFEISAYKGDEFAKSMSDFLEPTEPES